MKEDTYFKDLFYDFIRQNIYSIKQMVEFKVMIIVLHIFWEVKRDILHELQCNESTLQEKLINRLK